MNHEAGVLEIRLDEIIPNRFQPRLSFDEKALNELTESIKQHGIIQPLVLRRLGDKYEIIAGERRYKAAGLAGLTTVPAVLANIDDNTSAEVALVENIQRKDLTAVEEAVSYKNLLDKDYLTQDQLAKRLGVSQSAISNKMRLLNLDQEVQDALLSEKISERHARALLMLEDKEDQKKWLQRIIRERMTVRQLDLELKKLKNNGEESADVPLVNLTPNIDEIINNAMDIHPAEQPKIVEDIFGGVQAATEADETSSVLPPKPEDMPRKFFNFLEDEEANLNTNEEIITGPAVAFGPLPNIEAPVPPVVESITPPSFEPVIQETDTVSIEKPIIPEEPQINIGNPSTDVISNTPSTEVLDFSIDQLPVLPSESTDTILNPIMETQIMAAPIEKPQFEIPTIEQSLPPEQLIPDINLNPVQHQEESSYQADIIPPIEEPIPNYVPIPDLIDPVNMIDKLDPEYEQKQAELAGFDLNTAIADIRGLISNIESRGFKTDIEEINFDESYQINIKIEKE